MVSVLWRFHGTAMTIKSLKCVPSNNLNHRLSIDNNYRLRLHSLNYLWSERTITASTDLKREN